VRYGWSRSAPRPPLLRAVARRRPR
jgi:hypothetical protein